MRVEADRMSNIAPPPAHYASEKAVVLEERKQRTENDPKAQLFEQVDSALFTNHPYANPIIGWMDEIKRYEWGDVKAFYDTWYAPNNATVVISGDVTMADVKPLAEQVFGEIPPKKIPSRARPSVPPMTGETQITLHSPQIRQPFLYAAYIAPVSAGNTKDSLALQVLGEIMDGGSASRLYQSLVVEQKRAVDVFFDYNGGLLDYGTISIGGTPAQGVDVKTLQSLLDEEIKKVIKVGVSAEEVTKAIRQLQDQAIFARDSLMGPAMIFGAALSTGSSVTDIETWTKQIGTINAKDVQHAAMKYLNNEIPWVRARVMGYLLPQSAPENTQVQPKDISDAPR